MCKNKCQRGLQQPRLIAGDGPYCVVIGFERQFYRLFTDPDDLPESAADRDGPYAGASLDRRPYITRRFCLNKRFGTAAALLSRAFAGFALDQCAIGLRERYEILESYGAPKVAESSWTCG
jgi:hypothetical protein